jgi:hypothetical protein
VARARPGWWQTSVADLAGGTETTVGGIRVPASWGGLDLAGRGSAMWVEFYAANAPGGAATGELVPHSRVRFGTPAAGVGGAGGGAVAPAGHANRLGEGECANSRVGDDGDGVLHEMGIPPPASADPR